MTQLQKFLTEDRGYGVRTNEFIPVGENRATDCFLAVANRWQCESSVSVVKLAESSCVSCQ